MDVPPPPPVITYSDAEIRGIVVNLNATVTALVTLRNWVARSCLAADALVETPERAYLHLAGVDRHGRPVVLVLEQHRWSRAVDEPRRHRSLSARPTRSSAAAA